jgi:hypothetical protein
MIIRWISVADAVLAIALDRARLLSLLWGHARRSDFAMSTAQ